MVGIYRDTSLKHPDICLPHRAVSIIIIKIIINSFKLHFMTAENNWEFNEKDIPASNWFKFNNVGDSVMGIVVETFQKKGDGTLPDQKVFVLKQKDGEEVNVGIKENNTFVIQRTNKVRAGDMVKFEFTKEIPATQKGFSPAKSITPYVKYTPEGDKVREVEKEMGVPF